MESSTNYLSILGSLKFDENAKSNTTAWSNKMPQNRDENSAGRVETDTNKSQKDVTRVVQNIAILKEHIETNARDILQQISDELQIENQQQDGESYSETELYCIYLEHVLCQLITRLNFESDCKEDLISTRQLNVCIAAIQDLSLFALRENLHPLLRTSGVFATNKVASEPIKYSYIKLNLELFSRFLRVKRFHCAKSMASVICDYIASVFTLLVGHSLNECSLNDAELKQLQEKLDYIWAKTTKTEYFRNILLLKSCRHLPMDTQKRLHQELLQKLSSPDGFTTLVTTLTTSSQLNPQDGKQTFEIIANIVAFKGHSERFQFKMLQQIFQFISLCLVHADSPMIDSMGAGLLSLRRLYDLNVRNRDHIKNWLRNLVEELTQPTDLLTSLILMEHNKFCLLVSQLYHVFCTSSVECLPSEVLIQFMPLLLQLFDGLPSTLLPRKQVAQLVIRCLSNRAPSQLHEILGKLYKQNFDDDWLTLHKRILIQANADETVTLKIATHDYNQDFNISVSLPDVLMSSDHNILTYRIFVSLLKHMDECLQHNTEVDHIDLLHSQEDLIAFINSKYPLKVEIILSLNALVSHDGLRTQLAENASEFLGILKQFLEQRIGSSSVSSHNERLESADQILLIMLTLMQEVLEYTQMPEQLDNFIPSLKKLKAQTPNELVKRRADSLITLAESSGSFMASTLPVDLTPFGLARASIESSESYLQVYGIQSLLNLLRRRDAVTMANAHLIIVLALTTLKQKESYTFLNCVRLFVALLDIKEAEVLEVLSDEYLNERACMDYRLVVGEAILKVSRELGSLSYKYKGVLINCFLHGARSRNDEFRWSSFSNLSQLCRTLSYQVHKFFNELITLIDCELSTGKYLPAKRAAVLVIAELLEGMDNILDFEEMLLPIYRLLKFIEADENADDKMRIHAANGLKALATKFSKFLFPQRELEKPIQILGIERNQKRSLKSHILEIN